MKSSFHIALTLALLGLAGLAVFFHQKDKNDQVNVIQKADETASTSDAETVVRENPLVEGPLQDDLTPRKRRRVIPIPGVAHEPNPPVGTIVPEEKLRQL